MTGLRQRQKADRSRRILDAATGLFHELGYDSARIEDIAVRAEVAVGTLYNYYENKGDILLAAVSMEVEEVLSAGDAIVDNPPSSVLAALNTLIGTYYDHSLYYLSKEMWRTAMAISIQQPESPFSGRYSALDRRLCRQVARLIETLQRRGIALAGLDAQAIGEMVFNNLNQMFVEFVKDEAMTLESLKGRVEDQNRPLAQLIADPATGHTA